MPHPTITARFSHIAIVSWGAPAGALARYLPQSAGPGAIEPDTHPAFALGDGRPGVAVSLVAMSATNMKVLGVRWPRMGSFRSVSLRIAVRERDSTRRGVVVVRDVVSSRPVAWLLRRWYNQPAVAAPMDDELKQQTLVIGAEYRFAWPRAGGGVAPGSYVSRVMPTDDHMLRVVGTKPSVRPSPPRAGPSGAAPSDRDEPVESFLTERPFVFGLDRSGGPSVYEFIHPSWGVHPAVDSTLRVDIPAVFGPDLGFLGTMQPRHVMLAVGSDAAMFSARRGTATVRWGEKRS